MQQIINWHLAAWAGDFLLGCSTLARWPTHSVAADVQGIDPLSAAARTLPLHRPPLLIIFILPARIALVAR